MRGTGKTTEQMQQAPPRAIYLWLNASTYYPKKLARELRRNDLEIMSINEFVQGEKFRGRRLSAVVVDHAVYVPSTTGAYDLLDRLSHSGVQVKMYGYDW